MLVPSVCENPDLPPKPSIRTNFNKFFEHPKTISSLRNYKRRMVEITIRTFQRRLFNRKKRKKRKRHETDRDIGGGLIRRGPVWRTQRTQDHDGATVVEIEAGWYRERGDRGGLGRTSIGTRWLRKGNGMNLRRDSRARVQRRRRRIHGNPEPRPGCPYTIFTRFERWRHFYLCPIACSEPIVVYPR